MSVYFNGFSPSHIMYNGAEAQLFYNGTKIWPTAITIPRYKFTCSGVSGEWGEGRNIKLRGIKINDALIPVSSVISAYQERLSDGHWETTNSWDSGSCVELCSDNANIGNSCVRLHVGFKYIEPITSVSWHPRMYGQSENSAVKFTLTRNNSNVLPPLVTALAAWDDNWYTLT